MRVVKLYWPLMVTTFTIAVLAFLWHDLLVVGSLVLVAIVAGVSTAYAVTENHNAKIQEILEELTG